MKKVSSFLTLQLIVFLGACGLNSSEINSIRLISNAVSNHKNPPARVSASDIRGRLNEEVVAQFRGAPLLIATMGEPSTSSILFGVGENKGVVTFYTPDQVSLSFRDGVLVATRGLGFDLMYAEVSESIRAIASKNGTIVRTHETLRGDNTLMKRTFQCAVRTSEYGKVVEGCSDGEVDFQNVYSFGRDGKLNSSKQWIGEERGYIFVEVL
jgi:hypothetical protein